MTVKEETVYPFEETVKFSFDMDGNTVQFPFYLRIPAWCKEAIIKIIRISQFPEVRK
ncbi:MAG: glycoside hydrolase family 127 protein [Agriterribacter sp.]